MLTSEDDDKSGEDVTVGEGWVLVDCLGRLFSKIPRRIGDSDKQRWRRVKVHTKDIVSFYNSLVTTT